MKIASKSGFLLFLGGIFAARNVVHVKAMPSLEPPALIKCIDAPPLSIYTTELSVYDTSEVSLFTPLMKFSNGQDVFLGDVLF